LFLYWLGFVPMVIGITLLLSFLLKFLWNTTMPEVFNLNTITFWQAFRVLLISCILFGGPIMFK